jgi:hypothetical protein
MSKKVAPKQAKIKDGVEEIILSWFRSNNKPATTQSLVDALGSKVSKAAAQKALDALIEHHDIVFRDFKKVRLYFLDQAAMVVPNGASTAAQDGAVGSTSAWSSEDTALEETLTLLRADVATAEAEVEAKGKQWAAMQLERNLAEARAMYHYLETEIREADARLSLVESGAAIATPEEMRAAISRYHRFRNHWRDRRTLAERVIDAVIGDSGEAQMLDDIGVVTDSSANVSLAKTSVDIPKSL